MKRVLLVQPAESRPAWPTPPRAVEPMGLLYAAGAFRHAGIEARVIDIALRPDDAEAAYAAAARGAFDGAGIALASQANLWSALAVAQDLKSLAPSMPVFTGGVFATLNAAWLLDASPGLDFVVLGEVERWVEAWIDAGGRWDGLPMVWHRERRGDPRSALPVPVSAGDAVPPDRSLTRTVIERGEMPSVVATRGCGGGCSFCCIARYYGSRWRHRPPESVVAELAGLVRDFGVRGFHFVDDNLFGHTRSSRRWFEALLACLEKSAHPLRFKAACRLDDLEESLMPAMRRAGFRLLKIGIETFNPAAQKLYRKPVARADAAGKLERLREAGIGVSLGFIMFDPYCTQGDLQENLDFLVQYPDFWSRHLLRSALVAYRGTRVEAAVKRDGLATGGGITGTRWRFRDPAVGRIHQRLDHLLRMEILDLEWRLHRRQEEAMRAGEPFRASGDLQRLLRTCWIRLFRHALDATPVSDETRRGLRLAEAEIGATS